MRDDLAAAFVTLILTLGEGRAKEREVCERWRTGGRGEEESGKWVGCSASCGSQT